MTASAIVLAALLLGEPPVTNPSDAVWSACRTGEPAARVTSCGKIANDTEVTLPLRSWALVLRGIAHADAGDSSGAILDLDRAAGMNPSNWIAFRLKGDLEVEAQSFDAALADIDHAIELNPDDAFNLLSKAVYFRAREDYVNARQTADQAIALDLDLPDPYFERGRIALKQGDYEQAILDFEKFRSLRPGEPATDYNLALAYRTAGQALYAETAVERVLDKAPGDVDALRLRAGILSDLGDLDGALADMGRAIALAPADLTLLYDRANIRADSGAWTDAIADYTAALLPAEPDPAILVARGYAYFRSGDDAHALADAEAALTLDRGRTNARWLKASALLFLERYEEALEAVADGLAAAPEDARFLVLRGRVLLAKGDALGAIVPLSGAIKLDPSSTDAAIFRAAALAKLGISGAAASELQKVLDGDPNNGLALEQMVAVQRKDGDLQGALSNIMRLNEIDPSEPLYWWQKGNVLLGLKYNLAAPDAFQTAIDLAGEAAPANLFRDFASALVAVARYSDAIAALKTSLGKDPDDARATGDLGFAEHQFGDNAQAVLDLKRAITLYKGKTEGDIYRLNLADSYEALQQHRPALDEYDRLLIDYPTDEEVLRKRGIAYRSLKQATAGRLTGDYRVREPAFLHSLLSRVDNLIKSKDLASAAELIDKAVDAAPDAPQAYFVRAWVWRSRKEFAAALEDLDRALQLNPTSSPILNNRADALLFLGRVAEAHAAAEQAIALDAGNGTAWVTLGQSLIESGELRAAIAACDKGIARNPGSKADAYFCRALARYGLGQNEEARRDLAAASRFDDGELAQQIAELRRKLH